MDIFRKVFEIKANEATVGENTIAGAASVMGVMDRSWAKDVMCPGCWTGALDGFKKNGFVPSGHDWSDYAKLVAMPTSAEERGNRLYCEAEFHSTSYAQEVRTICQERVGKGLSVGLSVGFTIAEDGSHWFSSGEDLWTWAVGKGYDMAMFDGQIRDYSDECRAVSQVKELFEYSVVTVPANPKATVDAVKSFPFDGCVTLADRTAAVCAAGGEVLAELSKVFELRSADGRAFSDDRIAKLRELGDRFLTLADLASKEAPDTAADESLQLDAEAFLLTARI